MVEAAVLVIIYLAVGLFVAAFLEVLVKRRPKTLLAHMLLGKDGADWSHFFLTALFFPFAILTEIGSWILYRLWALFGKGQ